MKIHELEVSQNTGKRRPGRGISAGQGKTAGRGTKGQKARTGKKIKPGFEGGQTKLAMRLPKVRGFKRKADVDYQVVNVADLAKLTTKTADAAAFVKAGLLKKTTQSVKLLGEGELKAAMTVKVQAATASAVEAVKKAGGSVEIVAVDTKPKKKASKKTAATK